FVPEWPDLGCEWGPLVPDWLHRRHAGPARRRATPYCQWVPDKITSTRQVKDAFVKEMQDGYRLSEPALVVGSALLDDEPLNDPRIQVARSVLNRHGLVAGATG